MRIALAQMAMDPSPQANLEKSLDLMEQAAGKQADLILFPEIQLTPFFPQHPGKDVESYALERDNPMLQKIVGRCKELNIMAAPNVYLKERGRCYDATLLIDKDGALLGIQKMVHIPRAECFYEQDYYTPSDDGFLVFQTAHGPVGTVVCFDRHYPESIRTCSIKGAGLILIPTANTADEPDELFQWEVRVQAFQNSAYIAMCNRVGKEDAMTFSGRSMVAGPDGELVALAGHSEELLLADIDPNHAARRREEKPYHSLRRPELYL